MAELATAGTGLAFIVYAEALPSLGMTLTSALTLTLALAFIAYAEFRNRPYHECSTMPYAPDRDPVPMRPPVATP